MACMLGVAPRRGLFLVALLLAMLGVGLGIVRAQSEKPASLALPVFDGHFAGGWENYSWGSTVNLEATAPATSAGAESRPAIAVEVTEPYGALRLHSDDVIDTHSFAALQFMARATVADEVFTVVLYDENGQKIGQPVPLQRYGGDPTVDTWKTYTIPLGTSDLDPGSGRVRDIVFQADAGRPEPMLYIAHLGFVTTQGLKEAQSASPAATAPTTAAPATTKSSSVVGTTGNRLLLGVTFGALCLALAATALGLRRAAT